jgi:hypothetical protein
VAGVVVLLLALGGCGGPSIAPTHVSGKALARCRALVDALPARVADQERTSTDADAPGATWGDPPIVLRCGVGTPADFDPVAKCQVADGLGWYIPAKGMFDQSADVVMTAISRTPYVEVTLPARDRPPATAMIDLTRVIKAHTTPTTRCS